MANLEALAKFVRDRRDELKMSQEDVRKVCGKSTAPLEAGHLTKAPQLDTLEAWAGALRVDPVTLCAAAFGRSTERASYTEAAKTALAPLSPDELDDLDALSSCPCLDRLALRLGAEGIGVSIPAGGFTVTGGEAYVRMGEGHFRSFLQEASAS